MTKIMFVCHGNICRSPMAEFVLKDMIKKQGLDDNFFIKSSATSTDEIGNPVHYGTKNKLAEVGISVAGKYAVQLTKEDCDKYDYILAMDRQNLYNISNIAPSPKAKVCRLLDFTKNPRDIADPWYTGDFDTTYADVFEGCTAFLAHIKLD
jgi:protein-tyrosine phosphatase